MKVIKKLKLRKWKEKKGIIIYLSNINKKREPKKIN